MLIDVHSATLVVIDLQERLIPAIAGGDAVVERAAILIDAARTLDVPIIVTEQYPKGLGPTVPAIKQALPNNASIIAKLSFSAGKNPDFIERWSAERAQGRHQVVLCGTETHVCVLQSALDLMARGAEVFLAIDAVGSRRDSDRTAALSRLSAQGVQCVTSEMVVFEWLEVAGTPQFKTISKLIK